MLGSKTTCIRLMAVAVVLGGAACSSNTVLDQSVCGDGVIEGHEQCDDGNGTPGDGCEPDCTFTCQVNADCDDGDPCSGTETCNTTLHRCVAGTPEADGTACTYQGMSTVCVSGRCGKPCTMDSDCDDGNPCNGTETCDTTYNACKPGTPLDCDDGLQCTIDSCDPTMGCVYTLIDADGDGYSPLPNDGVSCDSRGGDCDDTVATTNPGAQEICGNGVDDDCSGTADDATPTWYIDCDGDGYAVDLSVTQKQACTKPADQGGCTWTTTVPSSNATQDCDDTLAAVHPGAVNDAPNSGGYFGRPFCHGAGTLASGSPGSFSCSSGYQDWDYDCNGHYDQRYLAVNYTSVSSCYHCPIVLPPIVTISGSAGPAPKQWAGGGDVGGDAGSGTGVITPAYYFCYCAGSGGGYTGSYAPGCGYTGSFQYCTGGTGSTCTGYTGSQEQMCR